MHSDWLRGTPSPAHSAREVFRRTQTRVSKRVSDNKYTRIRAVVGERQQVFYSRRGTVVLIEVVVVVVVVVVAVLLLVPTAIVVTYVR